MVNEAKRATSSGESNTPEINNKIENKAGKCVKNELVELLPKKGIPLVITSEAYDRTGCVHGKFGRTLAVVYRVEDGLCINHSLLENHLAWRADEKGELLITQEQEKGLERTT